MNFGDTCTYINEAKCMFQMKYDIHLIFHVGLQVTLTLGLLKFQELGSLCKKSILFHPSFYSHKIDIINYIFSASIFFSSKINSKKIATFCHHNCFITNNLFFPKISIYLKISIFTKLCFSIQLFTRKKWWNLKNPSQ